MKSSVQVLSGHEQIISKGKLKPITMMVQTRSGNRKVTLVENLDIYGINLSEFVKECQHGTAASASISKPQKNANEQLLVQGNQILFIYKLLLEKYKIQKKYIKGLEYAPKAKKN